MALVSMALVCQDISWVIHELLTYNNVTSFWVLQSNLIVS